MRGSRYVEMLEQQQNQLVAGLQEMYRRLQNGEKWPGSPLSDGQGGHPLTHDILARLDLLHPKEDRGHQYEGFEEDCGQMQRRLLDGGAPYIKRRGSFSSDSEHDHDHRQLSPLSNGTSHSATPISAPAHQPTFNHPFVRRSAPMTPPSSQSPVPCVPQLNTSFKNSSTRQISSVQPAVLHPSTLRDPWAASSMNPNTAFEDNINNMEIDQFSPYDFTGMNFDPSMTSSTPGAIGYGGAGSIIMNEFIDDPAELELNNYLSQPVS
ncbi:MAG: hypothetical protein Q9157_000894 [Trypethelium eluteriae]